MQIICTFFYNRRNTEFLINLLFAFLYLNACRFNKWLRSRMGQERRTYVLTLSHRYVKLAPQFDLIYTGPIVSCRTLFVNKCKLIVSILKFIGTKL